MAGTFGSSELRKNIADMVWLSQLSPAHREAEMLIRRYSGGWLSTGSPALGQFVQPIKCEVGYATDRLFGSAGPYTVDGVTVQRTKPDLRVVR